MLRTVLTSFFRRTPLILPNRIAMVPARTYFPERKLMRARQGKYYMDPEDAAERVMRIFAIHDHIKDPSKMTLSSSFEALGLCDLDLVEICLGIEDEFDIEFTDEQCESFKKVGDIVEATATNKFVEF